MNWKQIQNKQEKIAQHVMPHTIQDGKDPYTSYEHEVKHVTCNAADGSKLLKILSIGINSFIAGYGYV